MPLLLYPTSLISLNLSSYYVTSSSNLLLALPPLTQWYKRPLENSTTREWLLIWPTLKTSTVKSKILMQDLRLSKVRWTSYSTLRPLFGIALNMPKLGMPFIILRGHHQPRVSPNQRGLASRGHDMGMCNLSRGIIILALGVGSTA